ncbi:hypothetical protein [Arthrobacter bambusae]|uniref:hypothetical protein n=1 Tax=Arthrobacter bambusae TaxID=1338426 RepID=UPI00277E4B1E|nr:hypothetical protein [Arthrobacter bambusae]MDQ0030929.1 hypothetical protein [Arthrobacter bambusae]MDQ0099294.1 hypothetical protein [Arthrobacter bambusae]
MRASHARTPFHALRSAALAVAIVALAAGAHVLSGGALPVAPVLLAVLALTGLVTTLATRFKLGLPVIAALLGAGQLVLHEAFTAFGPLTGPAPGSPPHHLAAGHAPPPLGAETVHFHEVDTPWGWLMLTGHALATAASALLLAKGEQALWQLEGWLRPLLQLLRLIFRPDVGSSAVAFSEPAVFIPRPRRNLRQDSRRGPPAAVVPS